MIAKSSINGENVPPGALITFIQKGMQYVEVESHLNDVSRAAFLLPPLFSFVAFPLGPDLAAATRRTSTT